MKKAVCSWCGGENVMIDAWAVFNKNSQLWELGPTFDAGYCDDCDGEANVIEIDEDDKSWRPEIWHEGRGLAYRAGELDEHQEARYEDDGGR
jgi:hypothetical protein